MLPQRLFFHVWSCPQAQGDVLGGRLSPTSRQWTYSVRRGAGGGPGRWLAFASPGRVSAGLYQQERGDRGGRRCSREVTEEGAVETGRAVA